MSSYGIQHIEYLFPYDLEEDSPPPPPPVEKRLIFVIDNPDSSLVPPDYMPGDAAISVSDLEVYSLDLPAISSNVKEALVVSSVDTIPPETVVGDIVYNETTNDLYQVGD